MDAKLMEFVAKERVRKRKVVELKSVVATLERLVPRDEKLLSIAKAELAELQKERS